MSDRMSRCVIYTRKSSEEGLDQDFNSLEAQREACEAYVRSQAHEGWKLLPDRFDDGGFSGGNVDRPGLTRLMEQVEHGRVDVIVIYKIDRLTRSLTDFARLAETFDKHGVSFVSVTQQFNTTTSMGRLMLNVLLSFAQFEREITGERIRDKIAASKKKGMWMGGPIPMGYSVRDRQLFINETEAAAVQRIFDLYLEEGNVPSLLERMVREGLKTPSRVSAKGTPSGDRTFTRGHLYKLLSNPLYIGRVSHKGLAHAGQHEAIIGQSVWDEVQALLAANTQGERKRRQRASLGPEAFLADRLFTEAGNPMFPTHASKAGRRYGYYVEKRSPSFSASGANLPLLRLPASEIDAAALRALREALADQETLLRHIGDIEPTHVPETLRMARQLAGSLAEPSGLPVFVRRVIVGPRAMGLLTDRTGLREALGLRPRSTSGETAEIEVPLSLRRRGRQLKITVDGTQTPPRPVDTTLVVAVARAFDWFDRLATGAARSIGQIAAQDGFDAGYVSHLLKLAFLSPQAVNDIIAGQQPSTMTTHETIWKDDIPMRWGKYEQQQW